MLPECSQAAVGDGLIQDGEWVALSVGRKKLDGLGLAEFLHDLQLIHYSFFGLRPRFEISELFPGI
jgi:hypothetical protein